MANLETKMKHFIYCQFKIFWLEELNMANIMDLSHENDAE